jgi:hypothetical protein
VRAKLEEELRCNRKFGVRNLARPHIAVLVRRVIHQEVVIPFGHAPRVLELRRPVDLSPCSGRPQTYSTEEVAEVVALARRTRALELVERFLLARATEVGGSGPAAARLLAERTATCRASAASVYPKPSGAARASRR